jgi:hypothetical protein
VALRLKPQRLHPALPHQTGDDEMAGEKLRAEVSVVRSNQLWVSVVEVDVELRHSLAEAHHRKHRYAQV